MEVINNRQIYIEFFGPINFYVGLGVKVIAALLLGLIIGLDREKKFKSAGIKTQILICVGSAIYTSVSVASMQMFQHTGFNMDPNRMTAQIVSGIGFLGAGAIIQSRGNVIGLTTAATIWVVAAIGIAVGWGYIFSALFFTLTILIILNLIQPILKALGRDQIFSLEIKGETKIIKDINREVDDLHVEIIDSEVFGSADNSERCNYHLEIKCSTKSMGRFIDYLRSNDRITHFNHYSRRKRKK